MTTKTVTVRIFRADGTEEEAEFPAVYDGGDSQEQEDAREFLRKIVNSNTPENYPDGYPELVHLLFEDKPTYMAVHEYGAGAFGLPELPMNVKGTMAYHNATMRNDGLSRSQAFRRLAYIHGDTVMLTGVTIK